MTTGLPPPGLSALEARLAQARSRADVIVALTALAWELRIRQPERAYALARQAGELAEASPPDQASAPGQAASLITRAFIDSEAGRLDQAMDQCAQALSLLEGRPPSPEAVNGWYTLSWCYFYIGDHPTALEHGLKALRLARELGSELQEAWALDAVASAHQPPADLAEAVQAYQLALEIFERHHHVEGQLRVLNNLAYSCYEAGLYDPALDAAHRSLGLARHQGLNREALTICCTLSEILMALGRPARAQEYLQSALASFDTLGTDIDHVYVLKDMGRVCLALDDLESASVYLQQALDLAVKLNRRLEQSACHAALCELCERQGHFESALAHYKQFHVLREIAVGEQAARRLTALKVTHQLETSQREAEIYRLRNVELQREIEERKHMQTVLERLATSDPLTGLHNRRHALELARREFERALRYRHSLAALLLDLDHFKQVNDRLGHAAGDSVLIAVAGLIRSALREVDIVGRYGGEEFVVLMPETGPEGALAAAERIRQSVAGAPIQTEAGPAAVTLSLGVAGWPVEGRDPKLTLEALLQRADAALYAAKRAGRNCVRAE